MAYPYFRIRDIFASLRSRHFEVLGTRKSGSARRRLGPLSVRSFFRLRRLDFCLCNLGFGEFFNPGFGILYSAQRNKESP